MAGDNVTFEICVINQGSLNASNVEVTDYTPTGLTFDSSPDFTVSGTDYVAIIPSVIAGATECVNITYQIDSSFMGNSIINDSEITADDGDDIDSTPGDDGTPEDTVGDGNTSDTNGGDDQDPEEVLVDQVYDLALAKTIDPSTPGPYAPGDNITYEICVVNQGTLNANNVEVTDYIPADMNFVSSPDFLQVGTDAVATITSIPVGATECLSITLQIDPSFMGTSISNDSEITADDGDAIDSTPADDATPNDTAGDGDVNDSNGGDDQDPATLMIGQVYDLSLIHI